MICRRCGLESSTTDICEWCKKPMLPEGGTISAKAKQELQRQRAQAETEVSAPTKPSAAGDDEMAPARPGMAAPPPPPEVHESGLLSLGAHLTTAAEQPEEEAPTLYTAPVAAEQDPLKPLGARGLGGQDDGSADLSAETSRYIGNDEENLLRPIERPQGQGNSQWSIDPATGRRKRVVDTSHEVPDNVRLRRSAPYGVVVAFLLAFAEKFLLHKVPGTIDTFPLPGLSGGSDPSFGSALAYGFYCAILFGFMLPALLVNRKWGSAAGFFIGIAIGFLVLGQGQDSPIPYVSIAAGALAGILVGRVTGKGIKRIVSV